MTTLSWPATATLNAISTNAEKEEHIKISLVSSKLTIWKSKNIEQFFTIGSQLSQYSHIEQYDKNRSMCQY